ncbi:hypothetical protein Drorol1_Dr00008840 [Drosera rotundifolia]
MRMGFPLDDDGLCGLGFWWTPWNGCVIFLAGSMGREFKIGSVMEVRGGATGFRIGLSIVMGKKFTELEKEKLKLTSFWHLIQNAVEGKLVKDKYRKSNVFIRQICKKYLAEVQAFHLKKDSVKIFPMEIKLIFGKRDGNRDIYTAVRPKNDNEFIRRRFPMKVNSNNKDEKELTRAKILEAFQVAFRGQEEQDAEDVRRLMTLWLLLTQFVPTKRESLSWTYICYVALRNIM